MDNLLNPTIKLVSNVGIDPAHSLTYDPTSETILSASDNKFNTLSISSETSSSFPIPDSKSSALSSEKQEIIKGQFDRLRFLPTQADTKMSVTQFGNILTSYSKKSQVAVANFGFCRGLHYWEIICPNKCSGIEVGVVKEGWVLPEAAEKTNQYIFFDFNTSTARTICIQLDLVNLEISAWLQSNKDKKKTQPIPRNTTLFPCVRINEIGNVAILNTKISDDQALKKTGPKKQFSKSQVKKALALCAITVDKEASSRTQSPVKGETNVQTQKSNDVRGYTFATEQELQQFKSSVSSNHLDVDQGKIKTWGTQIAKHQKLEEETDPLLKKAQEWLWGNLTKIVESYKPADTEKSALSTKLTEVAKKLSATNSSATQASTENKNDVEIKYIKASDSLLVTKDNLVKLVTRVNGEFNMNEIFSFNRPISPKDEVQLYLDLKPLQSLLQKVSEVQDFTTKTQNYSGLTALNDLLEAITVSLTQGKVYSGYLLISIVYKQAKRAIDLLAQFLESSIAWLRSLFEGKSEKSNVAISKDTSEDELTSLLNFILKTDEALYAMIQHEHAKDSLFAYWKKANSRSFSSFDRVETLTSLPDLQYDIIKLSDFGLLNRSYLFYDFKHYQNEDVPIESDVILQSTSAQVEAFLKKYNPSNSKNVPFATTLNNLPPQINKAQKSLVVSEDSPYVVAVSETGEVSIWNSNKALVFLCKSDLTKTAKKVKASFLNTKKATAEPSNPFGTTAAQPAFGFGGGFGFGAANTAAAQNKTTMLEPEELDEENFEEAAAEATATGFGFGAPPAFPTPFGGGGFGGGGFGTNTGGFGTFGSTGGFGGPAGGFGTPAPAGGFGFGATTAKKSKNAGKKKATTKDESPEKDAKEEKTAGTEEAKKDGEKAEGEKKEGEEKDDKTEDQKKTGATEPKIEGFSFSQGSTFGGAFGSSSATTSTFTFGNKPSAGGFGTAAPTGGFSFGTAPATGGFGTAPKTGFGFGAPATGGFGTAPTTGGFSFGTAPATGGFGTAPATGFAFGTGSTPAGGFSFGTAPATGGFGSTTALTTPAKTEGEAKKKEGEEGKTEGASETEKKTEGDKPAVDEKAKEEKTAEGEKAKTEEKPEDKDKKATDSLAADAKVEAKAATGFAFGTAPATTTATTGFSFGTSTATTSSFSFGAATPAPTTGFSFGNPKPATGGFSFGGTTATTAPMNAFGGFGQGTITLDDYVEEWEDFPPEGINENAPVQGFGFGAPTFKAAPAKKSTGAATAAGAKAETKESFDLTGYKATGNVVVPVHCTPFSPLIVGVSFEKEDNCVLRLRRFAYASAYIKKFFYKHPTDGIYSLLNSQLFNEKDFEEIQDHLTKDYNLAFSSLEPLYNGRNRYRKNEKNAQTERFFQSEWIELEDTDVKLPFKQVVKLITLPNIKTDKDHEIRQVVAIGQTDAELKACIIEVKTKKKNPYLFDYSKVSGFSASIPTTKSSSEFSLKSSQELYVFPIKNHLLVFNGGDSQVILLNEELNFVKSHPLTFAVKSVKALDANKLGVFDSKGKIHVFDYNEQGELAAIPEIKKSESSRDHLNTITQRPLDHLDEIINVLQGARADENLVEKKHIPVYQTPFSHSIRLQESEQYSRISLDLSLVKSGNKTALTEAQETQLRKAIETNRATSNQASVQAGSSSSEESHDFPLFERTSFEPGSLKYLPIIVNQVKGGAFSQILPAAYITTPSIEVFASKYADTQFTFSHLQGKLMLVDSITLASPLKPTGLNAYPLESGFVYLIEDLSSLAYLNTPQVSTIQEFRTWYRNHKEANHGVSQTEPVGFFRLGADQETQNFELLERKPARYIVLQPLFLRDEGKLLSAKDYPVEIGFFGAQGVTFTSDQILQTAAEAKDHSLQKVDFNMKVEVKVGDKWKELQSFTSIAIQSARHEQDLALLGKISGLEQIPLNGVARVNISHEELESGIATELRVVISPSSSGWGVLALDVQPVILSKNKDIKLNYEASKSLKNELISQTKHQELFKSLLANLCSDALGLEERKKVAQIVFSILSQNTSLVPLVFNQINLENYLLLNILVESRQTSFHFLLLLKEISSAPNFKTQLSQALRNLLPRLSQTTGITHIGVQTYFTLLYWASSDINFSLPEITTEFRRLLKLINDSRLPGYKILRSQYSIPLLSFEEALFDEKFILQFDPENPPEKVSAIEIPIQCKVLHKVSNEGDEYFIDLEKTHNISQIKLWFPEDDRLSNLRIQIWGFSAVNGQATRQLLVSKYYNSTEGVWLHLVKQAHDPSLNKYFIDSDQLSILGFEVSQKLRYIQVQVTYSFRAGLPNLNRDSTKKSIVPIVIGKPAQVQEDAIESIAKRFNITNHKFKNTVEVNSWLSFDKYDHIPGSPNTFLYEYSTLGGSKKQSDDSADNQYDLLSKLSSLQGELYNELYKQRTSEAFFQNQESVFSLCNKIQDIQIKLYNQGHKDTTKKENYTAPFGILLSIAKEVSQYLLKVLNLNKDIQQKFLNADDVKSIFDSLLLYESPVVLEPVSKLVQTWILPSLSKDDQRVIIEKIFQSYLTTSNSILHSPVENLYSTLPVVDFLVKLCTKNPENLRMILDKLGEVNSLIGNTYALIVLNETYLKGPEEAKAAGLSELNGDVIEALVRNLHYIIDAPEFLETEKQYLVGLITDILLNVMFDTAPKDLDRLYKDAKNLFRVFHYVTKNDLDGVRQKLIKILSVSNVIFMEKYPPGNVEEEDNIRTKAILAHLEDPYVNFFFNTMNELIRFSKGEKVGTAANSILKDFSEEITEGEWRGLTKLFIVHFYSILELDRKERLHKTRLQKKKEKEAAAAAKKDEPEEEEEEEKEDKEDEKKEKKEGEEAEGEKADKEEDEAAEKKEEKEKSEDGESEGDDVDLDKEKALKELEKPKSEKLKKTEFSEFLEVSANIEKFLLDDGKEASKESQVLVRLVVDLVNLLNKPETNSKNLSFSEYYEHWLFILKLFNMFKVTESLGDRIIAVLVQAFFRASPSVQDYVFPFLSLLFKSHPTFSLEVITQLTVMPIEMQTVQVRSLSNTPVDLFIASTLERISKVLQSQDKSIILPSYNEALLLKIVTISTSLLQKSLNFGGLKGVQKNDDLELPQLQRESGFINLLETSTKENPNHLLSFPKLLENYSANQKTIDSFVQTAIQWYLFNKEEHPKVVSPVTKVYITIASKIKSVLQSLTSNKEATKNALRSLLTSFFDALATLSNLTCQKKITGQNSLTYTRMAALAFEEILESLLTTEEFADFFTREIQGFQGLLKILGFNSEQGKKSPFFQHNEISEFFDQRFGMLATEDLLFDDLFERVKDPKLQGEISEKEFAKKVKIHRIKNQKWPKHKLDLTVNKNLAQKALTFRIEEDEYCLCFEFEDYFEIKNVLLSVLDFPEFNTENLTLIPDIHLEVGPSIQDFTYIGKLRKKKQASNQTYFAYQFEGFSKNLTSSDPEAWLKTTVSTRVKFMKLRFRKPVIHKFETFGIASLAANKHYIVNLSYLSVSGIDVACYHNINDTIKEVNQVTALNITNKISKDFPHAWSHLAENNFFLEKNQKTLETISGLMNTSSILTTQIILSICKNSHDFGNWLFEQILESNIVQKYPTLIGDLITNVPSQIHARVERLNLFLMKEAKRLSVVKSPEQFAQDFESFIQFVEILTTTVNLIHQESFSKGITLTLTPGIVETLVQVYSKFQKLSQNSVKVIKLIIIYLFSPKPFVVSKDNSDPKDFLELTYNLYKKANQHDLLQLLALISVGSVQASKWLLERIEGIFENICRAIRDTPVNQYKTLIPLFVFLNSVITTETIKKKFLKEKWHLVLINLLRSKDADSQQILKTDDSEILKNLQTFTKNVITDYSEYEEEFAQILKDDLAKLTNQTDNVFLQEFFLPLLKAESEIPICLYPYDEVKKQWIGELESAQTAKTSWGFYSKLLKGNMSTTLNKMLQKVTKKAGTLASYSSMKWVRKFYSQQDGDANLQKTIIEKVANKGPFMLLMEGKQTGGFDFGATASNQGKPGLIGIFSGKPLPQITNQNNFYGAVEKPDDGLMFYYSKTCKYHFPYSDSSNNNICTVNVYTGGGGISFLYNSMSPLTFTLYPGQTSYCSIDLLTLKPVEDLGGKTNIMGLNSFTNIEVWVLEKDKSQKKVTKKSTSLVKASNILRHDFFNEFNPLNFYRPMPVYTVPASILIQQLSNAFFVKNLPLTLKTTQEGLRDGAALGEIYEFIKNDPELLGVVDIEFSHTKFLELKQNGVLQAGNQKVSYSPNMNIFNLFKKIGGVDTLMTVATNNISKWKKEEMKTAWLKWIEDLKNLAEFPNFFEAFIKNPDSIDVLFQILTNKPEEESQKSEEGAKKWEEKELNSHKYIYQALADSFKLVPSVDACNKMIETKQFSKILDVLAVISKEKPRKFYENPEEEEKKELSVTSSPTKKEVSEEKKEKSAGAKKKGVGYGTDIQQGGFGQPPVKNPQADWNVNQFVEKKRLKNEQLVSLINVISNLFETEGWEPSHEVLKTLCESALLPLLESSFRNGSLVDMGKESNLYIALLRLVKVISNHKTLIPCLLELERHYLPKQRDSVYSLLSHMNDISVIFISCLSNTEFKKEEEESKESAVQAAAATGGFGFGGGFGDPFGQQKNDVTNAIQILQKPLSHSKVVGGAFNKVSTKEFVIQTAITANNPSLAVPNQFGFGFGGGFGAPAAKPAADQTDKKVEKKPTPSVFNAKVTQPEKKVVAAVEAKEEKKEAEKPEKASPVKAKKAKIVKKVTKKEKEEEKDEADLEKEDEAQQNERLAHEIIEVFEVVKKKVTIFRATDDSRASFTEILKKPLQEAYRSLLGPLRFDYMDMKDNGGKYKHYYGYNTNTGIPPQAKMIRLAQELADLSNSLPSEHTNAIYVRVDKSKVDLMKVMIMGSSGTPYAHGAFEYDVSFDDIYPNSPPKVNLMTTGAGSVRFNPNLYANGKVCLSLLGTWSGRGGENWNPKLSTFLQVLLSIQSLIMTEDIYFNEPGLEVYAGTPQGELENEGYSNVVRYNNIKFAMIEQIRNPPKGFETVVLRHFYLKKKEILEEVNSWIEISKTKQASYTGCQNYNWQNVFNQSKNKYQEMLIEIVKELETELNKIPVPSDIDIDEAHEVKRTRKAKQQKLEDEKPAEEIDVTYDKEVKTKELDITDEAVRDRWSRYIGAMGIEAVRKQANSSVFISGLGALGVEVAKNITLSGVKRLTLHDNKKVTLNDLSGQFFLEEEDVGKNRVTASLNKLQQLNFYVKIDTQKLDENLSVEEAELEKLGLQNYTLVIATEGDRAVLQGLDSFCRKRGIAFIAADVYGPFSRIFCDFGDEFIVTDKDGEEIREFLIKSISNEEQGLVTLLETNKHTYEDGDQILITEVVGMDGINETKHKIKVKNAYSFTIGDTRNLSAYQLNGKVKLVKNPIIVKFKSLEEAAKSPASSLDENLSIADWSKNPTLSHLLFETLDEVRQKTGKLPRAWNQEDSAQFIKSVEEQITRLGSDFAFNDDAKKIAQLFAFTCAGVFSPLAAFIGGFVAQEAVKALTNKFKPINQFFYSDCTEVLPANLRENAAGVKLVQKGDRYDGLRVVLGEGLFDKLAHLKIFMVGVGAIGCELLKNFAMLGLGSGEEGEITITDPDVIETSNLNRQFLFREKHLRKPKSQTAAASIIQMNKDLKGKIHARLDKVHPGSAHIFTDRFFEGLDIVANALDNVQARRYVDLRCVKAKTPLLESGTLGPKGHVQVIVPYKTESYNSQEDPQDEHDIPHCTLKMFPEETLHCVEWARDKFGKLFSQKPKSLAKFLEDVTYSPANTQELETLKHAVKLLKKAPTNFDDCVTYARHKFQKYFVNDIRQLLFTYPLDHKTKQGTPFWASPKRPPTEVTFDPTNILHASFIVACAVLRATIFGIPVPNDAWKDQKKLKIAQEAAEVKVKDFKPSNDKAKELATEVENEEKKQAKQDQPEEQEEGEKFVYSNEFEVYKTDFQNLIANLPKDMEGRVKSIIFPQEFEKDNDKNFHIEFIYALANCRSSNYKLEPMDWMTVKLKAGRIVPALATTTASIAGLQTIELCKVINNNKIEDVKNAFLNFAVPYLTLSEPGPVQTNKLTEKLSVTLWDRWEVSLSKKGTLKDLFAQVLKDYELECRDVMFEGKMVYLHNIMELQGREAEKEKALNQELFGQLDLEEDAKYADLTITFSKVGENQILDKTPEVRVKFI